MSDKSGHDMDIWGDGLLPNIEFDIAGLHRDAPDGEEDDVPPANDHFEEARRIVASWPKWKRDIGHGLNCVPAILETEYEAIDAKRDSDKEIEHEENDSIGCIGCDARRTAGLRSVGDLP